MNEAVFLTYRIGAAISFCFMFSAIGSFEQWRVGYGGDEAVKSAHKKVNYAALALLLTYIVAEVIHAQ